MMDGATLIGVLKVIVWPAAFVAGLALLRGALGRYLSNVRSVEVEKSGKRFRFRVEQDFTDAPKVRPIEAIPLVHENLLSETSGNRPPQIEGLPVSTTKEVKR